MKIRGSQLYLCLDKKGKIVISNKLKELKEDESINTTFFKLYSPVGYPILIKVK